MRLNKAQTLTFTGYSVGNYDVSGKWVEGAPTEYTIQCTLQPYREGKTTILLPAGAKAETTFVCFTEDDVKTTEQFDSTSADTTIIDGHEYVAMSVENWTKTSLRLKHKKVLLVRRDIDTGGSL